MKAVPSPRHRSGHLSTVFLTLMIDLIGFSIIFPLFPAMLAHYLEIEGSNGFLGSLINLLRSIAESAGDRADFLVTVLFGGMMAALYSFLQFIFAPIWGGLSDRWGRRPVILVSIFGNMVGYALWVFSGSFLLLFLSRVITGTMSANMAVASAAVADLTGDKARARGMALIGIAFALGFILGPAAGGLATLYNPLAHYPRLQSWGINPFSLPAGIALALMMLNWLSAWCFFGETLPANKRKKTPLNTPWVRIKSLIKEKNGAVRQASWVYFLFILAFSGMEFSLTFLAKERLGFTPQENGYLFVYIGIVMILAQGGIVRRLAPIFGEKCLTTTGITAGILGFLVLACAQAKPLFIIGAGLIATASGLINALMALTSLYSKPESQGRDMGVFRSAGSLGRAIGPLGAAFLYFSVDSAITYMVGAIALLVPLFLATKLPKPIKIS